MSGHSRKDLPGTNCPFLNVHTVRLFFGWKRKHCLQGQWLLIPHLGPRLEESLLRNSGASHCLLPSLAWDLPWPNGGSSDVTPAQLPVVLFQDWSQNWSWVCGISWTVLLSVNLSLGLLTPSLPHRDTLMVDNKGASLYSQNNSLLYY